MFQDRYMPDDQPSDEFELTRADRDPSPRHHSRKHEHKGKARHREDKPSQRASGRSQRASEELEDGEIEDGEVDAAGEAQLPAPAPGQERRSGAAAAAAGDSNGLTGRAPDAADGKHRYRDADGAGRSAPDGAGSRRASSPLSPRNGADGSSTQQQGSRHQRSNSSRPPSGLRSRSRSRSRPRSSSRDRSRRQRSNRGGDEQPGGPRSSGRGDRSREPSSSRDRSRPRDSSRGPAAGGSAQHERERERYRSADGSSRDRDRDRERYPNASRDPGSRDNRDARDGRDARQRSSRDYDSNAPAGYRERQAARERDRGSRGDDDRDRKRRSRSRDRGGEQRSKRSRDGDGERRRRRSSDDEPELDIDPAELLAVDPLGLSAAEREAEEEARRLEESRKRRQAILAKHQQSAAAAAPTATAAAAAAAAAAGTASEQPQQPPGQQQEQQEGEDGAAAAAGERPAVAATPPVQDGAATPEGDRSSSEDSHNAPGSPVMDIWNRGQAAGAAGSGGEASRADEATSQLPVHLVVVGTEPNMQSERLRVPGGAQAAAGSDAAAPGSAAAAEPAAAEGGAAAAAAAAADDMFADVDDDMFAAADEGAAGGGGAGGAGGRRAPAVPAGLTDNYDDAEGYYNFQVGEVLDSRYEVFACKGKGVFSTVLRARDKLRQVHPATGQLVAAGAAGPGAEFAEVAIKVIRSNETMAKAAALEQRILRLLSQKDPDNKKHVIRLLRTFEYRQHVCMVFEPMDMNLRELTLKYGRNVGLNITAVAIYAAQLLVALRHLQQCRVLHADIKPDNILVNARRSKVKICDLGSAMLAGENERTPYLVSRFYRSPEVILGLAYDFPMDMWSVGCVLYELFTGKILFPGRSNNEMLKLMMDVKGPFPKKMLKKGIFVEKHFEDDAQLSFALVEEDAVTKQPVRRVIPNPTAKHNFSQLLARAEGDRAQVAALADLLERMLALDPDKRIEADAALRHPFVKPWLPKKKAGGGAAAGGGG